MATENTPSTEPDWAAQQADRVIDMVDTVKGFTTDRIVLIARGLVFGTVALVLAIAALLMTVTITVRMADAYLPIGAGVGDATWAAYLFIGGVISILGLGLWGSRRVEGDQFPKPLLVAIIIDAVVVVAIVCYGIIRSFS